jgi:2-succinyl-5-enolpyruvyl-6-hydroxy-3-cyclohexene-1-carboxylate synthase
MLDTNEQNIQTLHAATLVRSLVNQGLKHVFISPGSRSTPLTLAFATHPKVQTHVVIDERSAAFMALGVASESGVPAALVCTSGTAIANYAPAVSEAQKAGLPMIVLSSDRDFNEMNTGANQWVDQNHFFGNKAVFFANVQLKDNDPRDLLRLELLADQAWIESIHKKGCAHLNIPFRKPLEPTSDFLSELPKFYNTQPQRSRSYVPAIGRLELDQRVIDTLKSARKPVIIVTGNLRLTSTLDLLGCLIHQHVPVLIEPGSISSGIPAHINWIDNANAFLRHEQICSDLSPDLIIRFGSEPIGKGILNYLNVHQSVQTIRFSEGLIWSNSVFSSEMLVSIGHLSKPIITGSENFEWSLDASWISEWLQHNEDVQIRKIHHHDPIKLLRDGDVYKALSKAVSQEEVLFVSNSFPARDIDTFSEKTLKSHRIFMNRGASGIDGITSTAIGVAISARKPLTLIIGDLAYLHDLSALIPLAHFSSISLRMVVINNNGGGIFSMLPIAESTHFNEFFRTPQQVNASALAAAAGLTSIRVSTYDELVNALETEPSIQVIECVTDADESMKLRKNIWR